MPLLGGTNTKTSGELFSTPGADGCAISLPKARQRYPSVHSGGFLLKEEISIPEDSLGKQEQNTTENYPPPIHGFDSGKF